MRQGFDKRSHAQMYVKRKRKRQCQGQRCRQRNRAVKAFFVVVHTHSNGSATVSSPIGLHVVAPKR